VKILDSNGRLPPALAWLLSLIWLAVGFIAGWYAHTNWALRSEANQLVEDAKVMVEIRKTTAQEKTQLERNIEKANQVAPEDACHCLDRSHEYYVRQLRGKAGTP